MQCARADVPLDHDRPRGPQLALALALARRPATDPEHRVGTLSVNNGGPGNSVVDLVRGDAQQVVPAAVQARFDVVGFDPRGVGQSTPVRCFSSTDEQQAFFADRPAFPVGAAEAAAFTQGSVDLAKRCGAHAGPLLAHLSTADVARDLELLRRSVGDAQLTFAGYSYGGLIGTTYANRYPGSVRALLLDGTPSPAEFTRQAGRRTCCPSRSGSAARGRPAARSTPSTPRARSTRTPARPPPATPAGRSTR